MSSSEKLSTQLAVIGKKQEQIKKILEEERGAKTNQEKSNKFEKKKSYVELFISILAFGISLFSMFFTICAYIKTTADQQETQAYNYWQNFLELAVEKPEMANGDDSHFFEINKGDSGKRVEYEWFVANALGAAEIVFRLQPNDKEWRNTLKEIIGLHSKYINSTSFDTSHYSKGFFKLIKEATNKDQTK